MSLPFEFRKDLAHDLGKYRPFRTEVTVSLIHRIGVARAKDAIAMFEGGNQEAARAVGYKRPYHFFVEPDGIVVQAIPLSMKGSHAYRANRFAYGIACCGDFRTQRPSVAQWNSAAMLADLLGLPVEGHTAYPEATTDPHKVCPGSRWDMEAFRKRMAEVDMDQYRATWEKHVAR